jgi:peptidoglycan/LPS O-acetylase OafA/YrhL
MQMIRYRIPPILPLTSVRGIAAWWVAVYHFRDYLPVARDGWIFALISRGFYAVDLFFILSGFILYVNHGNFFKNLTRFSLYEFFSSRVSRVYPLHLFMMIVFILNPLAISVFSKQAAGVLSERYSAIDYVLSLFLIQNWGFRDHLTWNIPSWSISTELAAYILFPVASYLALRHIRNFVFAILAIAVLQVTIFALFREAGAASLGNEIPRLGLARCVLEFLMGLILGRIFHMRGPPKTEIALIPCFFLMFILYMGTLSDYLVIPAAFLLMISGLTAVSGNITKILSNVAFVYLGTISYSTYMVHFFISDWVKFLIVREESPSWIIFFSFILITFIASILLYTWVEVPLRAKLRAMVDTKIRLT